MNHAPLSRPWLQVLANDKHAIVSAPAHAQRAVDLLHGLQQIQRHSSYPPRRGKETWNEMSCADSELQRSI
jgi:antirestriction protein ArdC